MKPRIALFTAAALLAGIALAPAAQAGDLYVFCNSSVSLQAGDLRDVFMGEKQFAGSVKLQPADNGASQAAFLEKVLKMDAGKYSTTWTKKSFRDGVNPPPVKGTDAEAVEYAKRTPGGCSYSGSAPGGGVTVVAKL